MANEPDLFWCGCLRRTRWQRCDRHGNLPDDQEPLPPRVTPEMASEILSRAWMVNLSLNAATMDVLQNMAGHGEPAPERMVEARIQSSVCADCDRPLLCATIKSGTGPCGRNRIEEVEMLNPEDEAKPE